MKRSALSQQRATQQSLIEDARLLSQRYGLPESLAFLGCTMTLLTSVPNSLSFLSQISDGKAKKACNMLGLYWHALCQ